MKTIASPAEALKKQGVSIAIQPSPSHYLHAILNFPAMGQLRVVCLETMVQASCQRECFATKHVVFSGVPAS